MGKRHFVESNDLATVTPFREGSMSNSVTTSVYAGRLADDSIRRVKTSSTALRVRQRAGAGVIHSSAQ